MSPHASRDAHVAQRVEEMASASFRYPRREELGGRDCDLVMKGGITSGIVYPLAACELAREYRFRAIGGSSAGAIGAVMVAAAEHGRDSGGFHRLAELPTKLGPCLGDLFTAGPRTATALAVLKGWLEPSLPVRGRLSRVATTLVGAQRRAFGSAFALVLATGLVAVLVTAGVPRNGGDWVGAALVVVLLALPVAVAAAFLSAIVAELQSTRHGLAGQGFGVCVGSDGPQAVESAAAEPGPFTDWMTAEIDRIAGVPGPLTFGDLRGADPADPSLQLRVMTTNVTLGRPQTFPFHDRTYLFDPLELSDYFPPRVIARLLRDQQPATTDDGAPIVTAEPDRPVPPDTRRRRGVLRAVGAGLGRLLGWATPAPTTAPADARPLYWLPPADELPVVLAARLSLSFPGLISAVPLWALEGTAGVHVDATARRCWMTDGGLTANFPVHFFDSPFPCRPTFAIDLQTYPDGGSEEDVFYAGPGEQGLTPRFRPIASVQGFVAGLLDTIQYWADNAQSSLPGYRDRIVQVRLRADEGGMNLQMPPDVVHRTAEKGRQAAEALREGFDFDAHRWIRFLTVTGRLQTTLDGMEARWADDLPGGLVGYERFVMGRTDQRLFGRDDQWRAAAVKRTDSLLSFASPRTGDPDFVADAPRPDTELRMTPKF